MKIAVIGLGYVGLPLAAAFSEKYEVTGFDVNAARIEELKSGYDRTLELSTEQMKKAIENGMKFSLNLDDIKDCNFFIVTVPTPIDKNKRPDLTPVVKATQSVAKVLKKGDIVLTFYPADKNEIQRKIQIKSLEVQQKQRDLRNASELKKIGGASAVSVDDARIALQTAQLELSSLREDYSLLVDNIKSPVDGVITAMTADENYRVNTETTLFKVSDSKNMKVEVSLTDTQIQKVAIGQRVEITSDALPAGEKIEGTVSQISGVATKNTNLDESDTNLTILDISQRIPKASSLLLAGRRLVDSEESSDPMDMVPYYIRRSEAEVLWEERHKDNPEILNQNPAVIVTEAAGVE